jgi:hypothetical protein
LGVSNAGNIADVLSQCAERKPGSGHIVRAVNVPA